MEKNCSPDIHVRGEPPLFEGEKIVLRAQGSFQEGRSGSSWKLGHLYLTNKRLFFIQVTKQAFGVGLDEIRDLRVVKRGWLLGVRIKQLGVSFKAGGGERTAYIALEKPERWVETIKESMTLMLADKRLRPEGLVPSGLKRSPEAQRRRPEGWGYDASNPGSRGHAQRSTG